MCDALCADPSKPCYDSNTCSGCYSGSCTTACTLEYNPVCCDGTEYPNDCHALNANADGCHTGTCEEPCVCGMNYDPVICGDKTYGNICNAQCNGEDLVACDFSESTTTPSHDDDDEDDFVQAVLKGAGDDDDDEDDCTCSDDRYQPVCCQSDDNDSTTQAEYRNECYAKCAGEEKSWCSRGECSVDARAIFGAADQFQHLDDKPALYPVITINAVFIGLIILAVVAFVVIYAQKAVGSTPQKLEPRYDSDL